MFERRAYSVLLDWKKDALSKALLIDGARQIGKTFLVEQFAHSEYTSFIKIDFLEDTQAASTLMRATSAREAMEALSLIAGRPVEPGRTLVFLDEVQAAQNLVTFSKYIVQDGRFPLVMSGSMLGVELKGVRSFPVGFLREELMHPLDFLEFCRALSVPESVIDAVEESFHERIPIEPSVHERLMRIFRLYIVIGGMPKACEAYLNNGNDLGAARFEQESLVALYREDISKYAGDRALQVKAIYDSIPAQIDKENKRFLFKQIKADAKFERYANDFAWLVGARAALKTTCVRDPKPMLKRSEEDNRFKLYLSDVGMLMSQYHTDVALAALSGERNVNFGGVYENAIAQELEAWGVPLHYYHNTRLGEVDFMGESSSCILPIEVKSGKGYKRHVALNNLLRSQEYGIDTAYVLSESNVASETREGKTVYYLPLYMIPFVAQEMGKGSLDGLIVNPPSWDS